MPGSAPLPPAQSQQVRDLFDAVVALPTDERTARLDAVPPRIRREVDALLAAYDAHDASLDEALDRLVHPDEGPTERNEKMPEWTADSLVGKAVGPYDVEAVVGAGGMGVVYRARDRRLGRRVVLKMLPSHLQTDARAQKRLRQEAQAASVLDHSNVATIYDVGETEAGQHYVAMAYVEGDTLADRLRNGPLPVADVIDLVKQVARGLGAAHAEGIIHRDVKPSNVIVTPDGTAKIVDFGVAKVVGRNLTQTGATVGTAAYMSPEQARGEGVDARADLWALGVLAYEMLTGNRPFPGTNTPALLRAITHDDPIPLSEWSRNVPPRLASVIEQLLQKVPEDRFASASALLAALDRIDDSASDDPSSQRASVHGTPLSGQLVRRWNWAWAGGVVLLLLAGIAWGVQGGSGAASLSSLFTSATAPSHAQPVAIAVLPIEELSGEDGQEAFASGMTEALIATLSQVQSFRVTARRSVVRFAGTPIPPSEIAAELGVDYLIDGALLRDGDRLRMSAHLLERGSDVPVWTQVYERDLRDVLGLQRDLAQAVAGAVRIELTPDEERRLEADRSVDPKAYELYLWGQHFRNREFADRNDPWRAYRYFTQAIQKDSTFAAAYAERVIAGIGYFLHEDKTVEARASARRALALDSSLAAAHVAQGVLDELLDWNWTAAERRFQKALALNPSSVDAHYEYGLLLLRTGRFESAWPHFEAAQRLDPLSILTELAMVRYFYFTEQYDKALDRVDRVLELDPDHLATHDEWLPLIHIARGDRAAALQAIERAEEIGGYEEHVPVRMIIAAATGDRATAQQYQKQAQAYIDAHPEERPFVAYDLGITEAHLGNLDSAYGYLKQAHEGEQFLPRLLYSPLFKPVRADPRFEAFREAMNMPAANTELARSSAPSD